MRVMVITTAGMSSRFSKSLGDVDVLKCLYSTSGLKDTLLYGLLHSTDDVDGCVVVGGHRFRELVDAMVGLRIDLGYEVHLVENKMYRECGSGYSLRLGLERALSLGADEIVFAEGDLYFDKASFSRVVSSKKDVITITGDPVFADRSVVLYLDEGSMPHYLYDTTHDALQIPEPFTAVMNSGQVWKFADAVRVIEKMDSIDEHQWQGTNLDFIQSYFDGMDRNEYDLIQFEKWMNCNTLQDYIKTLKYWRGKDEDIS